MATGDHTHAVVAHVPFYAGTITRFVCACRNELTARQSVEALRKAHPNVIFSVLKPWEPPTTGEEVIEDQRMEIA